MLHTPLLPVSYTTSFHLAQVHYSPVSPQKREGKPGIPTKHGIFSFNKTIFLYHGWKRKPHRKSRVSKVGKCQSQTLLPLLAVPQE